MFSSTRSRPRGRPGTNCLCASCAARQPALHCGGRRGRQSRGTCLAGVVVAARRKQCAVRREVAAVDRITVARQHERAHAAAHVPQAQRAVVASRHQVGAVGREDAGIHARLVAAQHCDTRAALRVPQPHGTVFAAGGQTGGVRRRECRAPHRATPHGIRAAQRRQEVRLHGSHARPGTLARNAAGCACCTG